MTPPQAMSTSFFGSVSDLGLTNRFGWLTGELLGVVTIRCASKPGIFFFYVVLGV